MFLVSCGSTSEVRTPAGAAVMPGRKFARVMVRDFKLATSSSEEGPSRAGTYFADRITLELNKTHRFAQVSRNARPSPDTLVIDGVITKYEKGSIEKRLWIGMGFGMAVVEADVKFSDNKGGMIGTIRVDKHSWPLGGALAAMQEPEDFINGAAEKIAQEVVKWQDEI
jgi:hypothetical protein